MSNSKTANILDPIHPGLSALVWDRPDSTHPTLKKAHRNWIKRTIYAALTKAGYTDIEKWLSLYLTGSLTTYQYSSDSDCDISLFVNTAVFPEWSRAEMIGTMVGDVDGTTLPSTPFPMQDFVVPPGVNPTDLYKKGLRSGYSLDTDGWVNPPERERVHDVQQEQNGFYVYALEAADKMERLLRYEPDKAVMYWHMIHKRRQRDQKAGKGDFAESNIVYKFLANRNLFPAISETSGEYIAKTAELDPEPPSVGWRFHTPRKEEQVAREGFRPVDPGPSIQNPLGEGVYFYDYDPRNPPEDVTFPNTPHGHNNLYEIDLRGLEHEVQPDYELERAWHHPGPIPAERIKHVGKTAAWQDWTNHIGPIAQAYERLPAYDPQAAHAWKELADNSTRRAAEIGQRLNVQVTDNPEPYASHQEMFNDINNGRFQVSRANSEHPVWTPEQNVAFRTVHDVEGHHPTGGDFSWAGENQACGAHASTLFPLAQKALMTECLGQTGWAIQNGGFGPQKVGFMDVQPHTFSVAPPEGFCHRHIRHGLTKPDSWDIMGDHGVQNLSSQTHQSELGQAPQSDEKAEIEPVFPSPEDAIQANQAALAAAGQSNHALLRPEVLESALGRAANQYYYTGSLANSAAALAHGVGQAQAFEDGNKRTAYWLTHQFLHENGLGFVAPDDDDELADHLIGYGEGTHQMEDTANMFRARGGGRVASDPWSFEAPEEKPKGPRQIAKFVYSPVENRLVLGEMGAEEGEKPNHHELANSNFQQADFPALAFGEVAPDGFVKTYGRPKIAPGQSPMNQYEAQWMTEEALRRALPHSRFLHEEQNHGNWGLPSDPEIVYTGEPPLA